MRYEWFQNDEFVNISVFIKGVLRENVQLDLHEKSISLNIDRGSEQPSFVLDVAELSHEIIPEQSSLSCLSTKVELKLRKKVVGVKWMALEGDKETQILNNTATATAPPTYPTSAKNKINWSAVEKDIVEDKPEGDQALNQLFQQIFKDGDENVKRAMMKSYIESGGTALSTNWSEVGKETVPIRPPDGMEAKKWM